MALVFYIVCIWCFCKGFCYYCQPSEVFDPDKKICQTTCDKGKAIFKQNCTSICPINTRQLSTGIASFCLLNDDFHCRSELCRQPYLVCYKDNCLQNCPEYTVEYNNTCLLQCPAHSPFLVTIEPDTANGAKHHMCQNICPSTHSYVLRSANMIQCFDDCPYLTIKWINNNTCSTSCPRERPFYFNRTCVNVCPNSYPYVIISTSDYNDIYTCVSKCPIDYIYDNIRCVKACPTGKHLFNDTCITECPDSHKYLYSKVYAIIKDIKHFGRANFMCVEDCSTQNDVSYVIYNTTCFKECPSYSKFVFDGQCYTECPGNSTFERIEQNGIHCVNACTSLTFNRTCVERCPEKNPYEFDGFCLESCPVSAPLMNRRLERIICTEKCTDIYDTNSGFCIPYCRYPRVEFNNSCVDECPFPLLTQEMYTTLSGKQCVDVCKSMFYVYNRTCVSECPTIAKYKAANGLCTSECVETLPYKFDRRYKIWWQSDFSYEYLCVSSCPADTFLYNGSCLYECPIGFRHLLNNTCLSSCTTEQPYKKIVGSNVNCLSKCPFLALQSKECVDTCPNNAKFNLNGMCSNECKAEFPFEIFDRHHQCVTSCPSKSFLLNNKTCVDACPPDTKYHYKSQCLKECNEESSFIFTNISNSAHAEMHYCVTFCPTGTFNANMTCVKNCPFGSLIWNSSCVLNCPKSHPLNYTSGNKYSRISVCVERCPNETYGYNLQCFDKCPEHLSTYNMSCLDMCPDILPLRDSGTGHCIEKCKSDQVLYHERHCEVNCKDDTPYLEDDRCVSKCDDLSAVYNHSSQGIICLTRCPIEMILNYETNFCSDRCADDNLIIDYTCRNVTDCPSGKYIFQTTKGKECRVCPSDYFIDGKMCVKYCSASQAMIERHCTSWECPSSHPIEYYESENDLRAIFYKLEQSNHKLNESLLAGLRKSCYKECPENYVANGTFCILELSCLVMEFQIFGKLCLQSCPPSSVKYNFNCHSITVYYILSFIFGFFLILSSGCGYLLVCFKGSSKCPKPSKWRSHYFTTELTEYISFSNDILDKEEECAESAV